MSNVNIISNTYTNGKGIIKFDGTLTQLGQELAAHYIGNDQYTNQNLIEVSLPDSIIRFAYWGDSFSGLKNLQGFYRWPANLTEIGDRTFYSCQNLRYVADIPTRITKIGTQAFEGCYTYEGNDEYDPSAVTGKLEELNYEGTLAEFEDWDVIEKGGSWCGSSSYEIFTPEVVHCSDGDFICGPTS